MRALIEPPAEAATPPAAHASSFSFPTPRALGVAVTGLLAFGVMLGSVVSPAAEGQAQSPIVVAVSQPPAQPPPATPADDPPAEDDVVADSAPVEAPVQQTQTVYETVPHEDTPPGPAPPAPLPIPPLPPLPSVSHVFVVMLSGHGYEAAFGSNSKATYLAKTLTTHGELIPNYYAVTHGGLANSIALLSGQGPTKQTAANCPEYTDVTPGTPADQGQVSGDGCVYPADVKTLADQLFLAGNTWKAYIEGAGTTGCDHAETAYPSWRNPFFYFHSIVDNAAACAPSVTDLSQLQTDLQEVGNTPGLSYIVPGPCHDGSDTPCAPDQPAGLEAADAWLQTVVPQIEASPGYKQGGLIAITFDQAPKDGPEADSSSCCGQPDPYPNLPADAPAQTDTTSTPAPVKPTGGGGKVGLLLISPFIKPATVNDAGYYNHFSLFASIQDLFTIGHTGYANLPDLTVFDKTVYTAYNGGASNGDGGELPVSDARASKRKH